MHVCVCVRDYVLVTGLHRGRAVYVCVCVCVYNPCMLARANTRLVISDSQPHTPEREGKVVYPAYAVGVGLDPKQAQDLLRVAGLAGSKQLLSFACICASNMRSIHGR
jgi:hypothetical protein